MTTFLQMGESATNVDEMISFAMEHLEHADLKVRNRGTPSDITLPQKPSSSRMDVAN